MKAYNLPMRMPRKEKTAAHAYKENKPHSNFGVEDLSEENLITINEIYQDDFRLFDYQLILPK